MPKTQRSGRRDRKDSRAIDRHVADVVALMVAGKWQRGKSHAELARKWRKPVRYVFDRAGEAGRHIRLCVDADPESIRRELLLELGALCADARRDGEYTAAVRGVETRAKLLGLLDAKPKEDAPPAMGPRTAAEALAFIEAMLPGLRARAAVVELPKQSLLLEESEPHS